MLTTRSFPPFPDVELVVVTDGRGAYLQQTLATVGNLEADWKRRTIIDDSGDPHYREWLAHTFGDEYNIVSHARKAGMAHTVRRAWQETSAPYVFHLEDDFTIDEPVDIRAMAGVLEANPKLAQLCLLRQPWNDEEQAAGGIIQANPGAYGQWETDGHPWVVHRRLFSLNPCLLPRWVVDLGWDDGNERGFTDRLLADPDVIFGYWGVPTSQQVTHIGVLRAPGWRL